jgi:hypothetical protein
MQQRGTVIRELLPGALRALLPNEGTLPFTPSIEGSAGKGRNARVPWVRIYSASHSPSAMNGWYMVLLFAADGSGAFLTLASGTSEFTQGYLKLRPQHWLQERAAWARATLAASDTTGLTPTIQLHDRGRLGTQYEHGTVAAYQLPAGRDVDDDEFEEVLLRLLYLLGELYTHPESTSGHKPGDTRHRPERRSTHYAAALQLAQYVLAATGRTIAQGPAPTRTFLIRTPR